ncbi:MAG: zf-TFIIB domain-containing protein [Verrucomicrobiota bacterium]
MLCPVEKSTLQSHREGAAQIFICDLCHGLWFSREQLANFLKTAQGAQISRTKTVVTAEAVHLSDKRLCPCCENRGLTARIVDGVEIDSCPQCHGIWLDVGELELIIARYRKRKKLSISSGNEFDGLDIPLDLISDAQLLSDVADIIGGALGHGSEWAVDAAGALLEFIGEAFSALDF